MLSHGSPLSSICPPGSRVICALSRLSAMMLPSCSSGSQPKRSISSRKIRSTPRGPKYGIAFPVDPIDADFFILGADAPLLARLAGVVKVSFQLVIFFNDRHGCECSADRAD